MLTSLGRPPGLRARLWAKSDESAIAVLSWLLWYCPSLVVRRRPVSCVTSGVIPLDRTPAKKQGFQEVFGLFYCLRDTLVYTLLKYQTMFLKLLYVITRLGVFNRERQRQNIKK